MFAYESDVRELGQKSPWWPYLATLPRQIELPASWLGESDDDTREALEWANGTELGKHLERERTFTMVWEGFFEEPGLFN